MAQLVHANDTKNYILCSFFSKKHFKVVSVSTYILIKMLLEMLRCYQTWLTRSKIGVCVALWSLKH